MLAFTKRCLSILPSYDITDLKDHFQIILEIPGVRKSDISINSTDGTLDISAKKVSPYPENATFVRQLRDFGTYDARFKLPSNCDYQKIKAAFEDGVLTVNVPRAESNHTKIEVL